MCFGLLVRLVLAWLPEKYLFYLVSDDAYYYFTIARNLTTRGMLSADGITLTNGFHPLWLFIITPIFALFKAHHWLGIHFALTFSAVFDTAAGFLIYKVLEKLGRPNIGFWAMAFYLVNPYGLLHTMNGLETAQNNFFLALLVYLSVKAANEWLQRGWFLLGVACGLAFLSRTDNIFALVFLLGYLTWRQRNLLPFGVIGVALAIVLPWLIYNYLMFGSVVQTSGTAYPWLYHQEYLKRSDSYFSIALVPYLWERVSNDLVLNAFHYGHWIATLLISVVLLAAFIKRPPGFRLLIWSLFGAGFFIAFHVFVRWSVRPWYPQVVFVLTLPAVALVLEKWNRSLVGMGMVLILCLSGKEVWSTPFRKADRSRTMETLLITKVPPGYLVGVYNSGYLQYFTDKKVINLDGLVNNEVLSYYKKNRGLEYFRKRNIDWLLDTPVYLGFLFGPYFGPEAERSLVVVEALDSPSYPGNVVILVGILSENVNAPSGREMPIWRESPAGERGDTVVLE